MQALLLLGLGWMHHGVLLCCSGCCCRLLHVCMPAAKPSLSWGLACPTGAGLTLWSISKTYKLPQEGADQLWAALQVGGRDGGCCAALWPACSRAPLPCCCYASAAVGKACHSGLQVEVTFRLANVSHGTYMTGAGRWRAATGHARQGGLLANLASRQDQGVPAVSAHAHRARRMRACRHRALLRTLILCSGSLPRLLPPMRRRADKHYNFGAQALSNIIYSAASMGLKADYDLLHAVGRGLAWEIENFRPQVGWGGSAPAVVVLGSTGRRGTGRVWLRQHMQPGQLYAATQSSWLAWLCLHGLHNAMLCC